MFVKHLAALGVAAALAASLAACSSGDNTSSSAQSTATAVGHTVTAAVSSTTPTPTSASSSAVAGVPAQYNAYVSDVCKAAKQFKSDVAATADEVRNNPQNAFDDARKPFDNLANNLSNTTPPDDMKAWQQQVVDKLHQVSNALQQKDITALTEVFQNPFPPVPDSAKTNLKNAAQNNSDCKDAGLFTS